MSDTEESKTEDIQSAEVENKLGKLGKYLSLASISILWVVSAVLGIRDLWIGKGIRTERRVNIKFSFELQS